MNLLFNICVVIDICFEDDVISFFGSVNILCVFIDIGFFILKFVLVGVDICVICLEINILSCLIIFY